MEFHLKPADDGQSARIRELEAEVARLKQQIDGSCTGAAGQEFHALADSIDQMIWATRPDGFGEYYNRRWYQFTGVPEGSTDGERWSELFHPDDQERTWAAWRRSLATGEPYEIEYRLRHHDGRYRWVLGRARPVRDEAGEIARWYGTCTDIHALKEAQEQARASEDRFRAMADSLPVPAWVAGEEGIEFVNHAFTDFAGRPAEELIGQRWEQLIHPDDLPALLRIRDEGRANLQPYTFEVRARRADGEWRSMQVTVRPRSPSEAKGPGYVGVATDLTDIRAADAALRRSEAQLRAVFDATPECIKIVAPDGSLMQMNHAGLCMIEAPAADAVAGACVFDLVSPEYRDEWRGRHARIVAGESMSWEFEIIGLEGTVRRMETHAVPLPLPDGRNAQLAVTRDVTHRSEAQDKLRASEERFRELADHIDQFAWTADATGWIHWYNQRWYDYTGTTLEMMEGWGWQAVHHPDHVDRVTRSFSAAIAAGTPWEDTFPLRRADGTYRWFLSRAQPIRDADGAVIRWFGTNTDIERLRSVEQQLRDLNETLEQRVAQELDRRLQAEEALRQAQKMETLGQLTGGVAHDFNNLLQIVKGNLDLLQRNLPEEDSRLRRAAENAQRGADRAAVLTQRLLAFSRRQPLAPKPVDPNRLVTSMSDLLHRTLGETVEVETELAADVWPVEADPNQLENAILNLAVNARDAMPDGGKVTIETANTHLDGEYAAQSGAVPTGQYVAICVTDTGAGMDVDTVARAFEPFFTTKEVGKGTGLGLSMVYGFVKQSGGHLKIYSEPGEGTTVKIYLPRLVGEGPAAEEQAVPSVPEGAQDETILVCEDDDDVRAYTVEVLRELGYRVLEAHDGPSALRLLERQEGRVDLLFTDVVLPSGMTGAVLAQRARALRPGLKVLFTTGYARDAIVHHGRLDAGVELITKPFSYSGLAARVREMLDAALPDA